MHDSDICLRPLKKPHPVSLIQQKEGLSATNNMSDTLVSDTEADDRAGLEVVLLSSVLSTT